MKEDDAVIYVSYCPQARRDLNWWDTDYYRHTEALSRMQRDILPQKLSKVAGTLSNATPWQLLMPTA